jgi:hypothetical protein
MERCPRKLADHDGVHLAVVIAGDAPRAVELEPALLAVPDGQDAAVHLTAPVVAHVAQHRLHVSAGEETTPIHCRASSVIRRGAVTLGVERGEKGRSNLIWASSVMKRGGAGCWEFKNLV